MIPDEPWRCVSMHDKAGRRGVWYRLINNRLELRGGREGDDAIAILTEAEHGAELINAITDVLDCGCWMQEDEGPNTQLVPGEWMP